MAVKYVLSYPTGASRNAGGSGVGVGALVASAREVAPPGCLLRGHPKRGKDDEGDQKRDRQQRILPPDCLNLFFGPELVALRLFRARPCVHRLTA